ncbi:MAG: hypothetical protein NT075_35180 [Chloroflexi bacterium]|nr:hypothetical protein [Chloroflexota bacterium]
MQLFVTFLPHILGISGALLILGLGWRRQGLLVLVSLAIYALPFLLLVGLTPNRWLHARPTIALNASANPALTTAVILGFGYDMAGDEMQPGSANQFLLDWVLRHQPQINTLLVQEGVRAALTPAQLRDKQVYRIHRHDPAIYVDTLDAAFCAMRKLEPLKPTTVLLVAHDQQLQRAAWDFERVRSQTCATCTLVIPDLPATPYPVNSVQWQTRSAFVYKLIELLYLRPRDLLRPLPTACKAPSNN